MCNLYSLTRTPEELRRAFRIMHDRTGNLPLPAIFPDQLAPIIRTDRAGEREMAMMRWGFPPRSVGARPVTNVRNVQSSFWRGWLEPRFRCLLPASSFCEYTDTRPKVPHWFALDGSRPLFAFAGIWRPWTGVRGTKAAPVEGEHFLYSFLTTEANSLVAPIHAKAMPVLLGPDDWDAWIEAPLGEALALQRPYPVEAMANVATGEKEDGAQPAQQLAFGTLI